MKSPCLKLDVKCHEYIGIIEMMKETPGLYHLDSWRERIHNEICELTKLTKEETKKLTDHLEKIKYDPNELASKLYLISKKKQSAPKGEEGK